MLSCCCYFVVLFSFDFLVILFLCRCWLCVIFGYGVNLCCLRSWSFEVVGLNFCRNFMVKLFSFFVFFLCFFWIFVVYGGCVINESSVF